MHKNDVGRVDGFFLECSLVLDFSLIRVYLMSFEACKRSVIDGFSVVIFFLHFFIFYLMSFEACKRSVIDGFSVVIFFLHFFVFFT